MDKISVKKYIYVCFPFLYLLTSGENELFQVIYTYIDSLHVAEFFPRFFSFIYPDVYTMISKYMVQ